MSKIPDDDQCQRPRCRKEFAVRYLGTRLCWKHWVEQCGKESPKKPLMSIEPEPEPEPAVPEKPSKKPKTKKVKRPKMRWPLLSLWLRLRRTIICP